MKMRSARKWMHSIWLSAGSGVLLQGCVGLDPDLIFNAFLQLATEFAIFFTDAAIIATR
jgi:hypothetical protein